MANSSYYKVPNDLPYSPTPPPGGYEMHPMNSHQYSSAPGYQRVDSQNTLVGAPDMQRPLHQRTDSENTYVGTPGSPEIQRPSYKQRFSSAFSPLLGSEPGTPGTPFQLQTRMLSMKEDDKQALKDEYFSRRQMRSLFMRMLLRFAFSTACCAAIVGVFKIYEQGVLDSNQKHIFNAIYIGLSMILSMNLISAFKSLAGMIRWRLLAKHELTLREVDLILALSSFQKTLRLLFTRTGKRGSSEPSATKSWVFRLGAISWILLGVAAQVAIALVGLTYNHENAVALKPGPVNITELQRVYSDAQSFDPTYDPSIADQKWAAHWYGIVSWTYSISYWGSSEVDPAQTQQVLLYDITDHSMTYYFKEWAISNTNPNQLATVLTNRSITVYPHCDYYAIPKDRYGHKDSPFVVTTRDGGNTTVDWLEKSGPDETIFVNPIWEDIDSEYLSCGDRCSPIYIFEFFEGKEGYFFNCTATVSEVGGAIDEVHEMPDQVARIFAGSPGSEGWADDTGRQSVRYSQGSLWGYPDTEGEDGEASAAIKVARFVAGAIAGYDHVGPMVNSTGMQSWQGVRLEVKWHNVYICLGMILAINLIFGVFIVIKANAVYCKDDSFLSTARLLRPLLERLGDSGSHLNGREIADTYENKVVYGYRVQNNIHHLDFGENINPLPSGKQFPDGIYN